MATTYSVGLEFKTIGASGIDQAVSKINSVANAAKGAQSKVDGAANNIRSFGRAAETASAPIDKLSGNLAGLAAQLGLTVSAIALFKSSLDAAFERGNAEQRLRNLTDSTAEYEFATKAAAVAANQFGLTQTQALGAMGDLYGRLKGVGYGLKEVNDIYVGFNTVARQGGVAAEEAAGAFFQFSQALGKGKLNGDEFVILGERMPQLLDHIATAAGIGRDQLSQFAQDGKLTGDVLYQAMVLAGQGAEGLNGTLTEQQVTMATVAQRAEEMKVQLGEALAPAFLTVMEGMANAALLIAKGFEKVNVWVQQNKQGMIDFVNAALKFGQIVAAVFIVVKAYQALQKAIAAAAAAKAFLVGLTGKGLFLVGAAAAAAGAAYLALGAVVDGVGNEIEALAKESADEMAKMKAEVDAAADGMSKLPKPAEDAAKAAKELKKAQEDVTKEIQKTVQEYERQMQAQTTAVDQALSVTQARLQAEQAINQVLLDQAQRQLNAASTQKERVAAAKQIYDLTVRQAELELQATNAAIEAELRKSQIALESAQLKAKEVEAVVRLAQAQGTVTQAHYQALAAQREAVGIAARQLDTATQVASAQREAAQAVYQGKVNAAQAAYETNVVAKNTQVAASAAGQFAQNMAAGAAAANDAAGAILRSTEAVTGPRSDPGEKFGAAGRNAAFMSEYAEAFNKLQKEMLTMSISQAERASREMMDRFMKMAEEYNRKAAAETNRRAMEEWNKYMPGSVGSQAMRQAVERDSLGSAMSNYGASSRSGGGSPQVNIAYQGSTVQMPDGNNYIKTSDANGIVGQAVRQTISTLGRDPAARRTAGIA